MSNFSRLHTIGTSLNHKDATYILYAVFFAKLLIFAKNNNMWNKFSSRENAFWGKKSIKSFFFLDKVYKAGEHCLG